MAVRMRQRDRGPENILFELGNTTARGAPIAVGFPTGATQIVAGARRIKGVVAAPTDSVAGAHFATFR
jgi:hypothetical protein